VSGGPERASARLSGRIAVAFGGFMHLVVGTLVLASAGVLAAPTTLTLGGLWTVLAVVGWRWRHRRPPVVLLLPFVVVAALWLAIRLASG
jgi:hypothetical protein